MFWTWIFHFDVLNATAVSRMIWVIFINVKYLCPKIMTEIFQNGTTSVAFAFSWDFYRSAELFAKHRKVIEWPWNYRCKNWSMASSANKSQEQGYFDTNCRSQWNKEYVTTHSTSILLRMGRCRSIKIFRLVCINESNFYTIVGTGLCANGRRFPGSMSLDFS